VTRVDRPDYLRETPRFDRSGVGMRWTNRWRLQIVDLFCGRGGVGYAIANCPAPIDPWMHAGFDVEDYSETYPGKFAQRDLLHDPSLDDLARAVDVPIVPSGRSILVDAGVVDDPYGLPDLHGLTADVVWASFPCTAYSSLSATYYGSRDAALEANPRITDEFRKLLLNIAPHYVIENVPGATRVGDLDANVRVNGLAFDGLNFDLERHFETTFPCPDAYLDGEPEVTIDTRDDQSIAALADAKGVPRTWGKQGVRSAIPWQYVYWVLHHCPAFPGPAPKRTEQMLVPQMQNALGVDERICSR
jgi:hypothetical protein